MKMIGFESLDKQNAALKALQGWSAGKSYHIVTYGCQMNTHDSEILAGLLEKAGLIAEGDIKKADIILFNTCCVRENAELKVFGNVGALKPLKRKRPELIVAVCGCMMQQKGTAEELKRKFPFVDLIFGTHNVHEFPSMLLECLSEQRGVLEVWDSDGLVLEGMPARRENGATAWVTVMYGCDNFCSYCIVPYVRGRERSRTMDAVLTEAAELAAGGVKELTLLGQNVNSYGKDLPDRPSFAELLQRVSEVPGIERVRFMTSHPKDLTEELMDAIAKAPHIANQLHLPVQSGSNAILRAMNRAYTREAYLELIDRMRQKVPNIDITTDLMVGFPGETEADFCETLDLVEKVRFASAFTFVYSKRPGTRAASAENQVPEDVKNDRIRRLVDLQNRITYEENQKLLGTLQKVLVERGSKRGEGFYMGRSEGGRTVNLQGTPDILGRIVTVKIVRAGKNSLTGKIEKETLI